MVLDWALGKLPDNQTLLTFMLVPDDSLSFRLMVVASLRIMRKDEAGMLASVAMSMRVAYGQMGQLHFREICSEELS